MKYNTKEDIEKLVRHETRMFFKAWILTQFEAGLRTGEVGLIKWDDIKFNVDEDISELSIYATKTKKARTVFVKEATFYLKKLKEGQENTKTKGVYVFHSKNDINKPVNSYTLSLWFRGLTQKALGRKGWLYLLRHSKASELYGLSRENKISRDTAQSFMGHNRDMSYVYDHTNSEAIKKMLKDQIFHIEDLPPEKKDEYEKKIAALTGRMEKMEHTIKLFVTKGQRNKS